MKPHRFLWAVLALAPAAWSLLTAGAAWGTGQEQYTIKPNYQEGLLWSCTMSRQQNIKQSLHSGGQLLQEQSMQIDSDYSANLIVAGVKDGVPTDVRVTFAKDCTDTMAIQDQAPQKGPLPLAGQTVTFHKGVDGNLTSDFQGDVPPQTLQYLNNFLFPEMTLYTLKPVAVGEEWSGDPKVIAKSYQLQGQDTGKVTCKLLGVKQVGGRQVAQIDYTANCVAKRPMQDQTVDSKVAVQGAVDVDLQSGLVVHYDLKITVNNSGTMQQDGQAVQTNVDLEAKTVLSATLAVPGAATLPVAGAKARGNAAAGGNTPAPTAADFAGNYTGSKIEIELKNTGNQIAGTITKDQQEFPLTAALDGPVLKGTFQSQGNKFDFTATLEGNTLKFTTGQTSYTLQKAVPAPANPLPPHGPANP